ncbi:hypothetical protein ILYODFUR_004307 [Ilyodon furcidens]|uniref:RING-type E3 ubiquitin transferase n=1 Tax=Ilyodon furcidens TaxID=33524 RepID=A0ABV0VAZ2_9TELE
MGHETTIHAGVFRQRLHQVITSKAGTNLEAITTCELCKEKLRLNIDNFDIQELYRTHVQSEYDEFISSGLYLVVLLHFCEQRFSDVLGAVDAAGLFNLVRILHEHMDSLESMLATPPLLVLAENPLMLLKVELLFLRFH